MRSAYQPIRVLTSLKCRLLYPRRRWPASIIESDMFIPRLFRSAAVTGVVSLALLTGACNKQQPAAAAEEATSPKTGKARAAASDFNLKDSNGRPVRLSDFKGKVVLLNFWATWCGPCKLEIPWFVEFEQKYKDRGLAIIGVSLDEDGWESVKPFLAEQKVNYRVVVGTEAVSTAYGGVESLPTTYLIDRDGKIAATHVGLVSKGDYEKEIVDLLDAKASAARAVSPGAAVLARAN